MDIIQYYDTKHIVITLQSCKTVSGCFLDDYSEVNES